MDYMHYMRRMWFSGPPLTNTDRNGLLTAADDKEEKYSDCTF